MRVAVYARVSTTRQAQAQTIEQQLDRLVAAVTERGWTLDERHVYRDDGYSGASLGRPGLDCLRDHAALAEVDLVVVTAPDRLARNYVHQVLLIDELGRHGCQVEFLDRPMSQDPHDQLLLQIRGAVAEYERTLIAERMRRGRQAKLRAGTLLPWTTPPFGYRLDPERPRDAAGVRVEPDTAVLVAQLFDWYLEPQATVYRLAKRLTDLGVPTPTGKPRWNAASVRGILRNPAYAGRALTNRTRVVPARRRRSALLPVGPGQSHAPRPQEDWIGVAVPAIVSEEAFARVQAKLDTNQQSAARNTRHEHLLRALVSCGACRLSCTVRRTQAGYRYYLCRGRTDALRVARGQRCGARYAPAGQLDELVWGDLCALLTDPAQIAGALERARGGAWLPQELQARRATLRQALGQLERQQQRLLDAYLAEVVGLAELERKRQELDRRRATLLAQQRQLDAIAEQRLELRAVADGIEAFCQTVRTGLATATFAQRRLLVELLIDRVIVTDREVEIRYVLPTSPDGPHPPFCQLRKDHLGVAALIDEACRSGPSGLPLSPGTYLALAVLNRVTDPRSKRGVAAWWRTTAADRFTKIGASALDHRRFWDAMHALPLPALAQIEEKLALAVCARFGLDTSSVALDMTNFATFIDTGNDKAPIAQRGKAKQKRADLRLVGLGLVVTRDGGIPLLSHAYPGNKPDATQFPDMIETLAARHAALTAAASGSTVGTAADMTVVFDAGQNSAANFTLLAGTKLHYVGSVPASDCADLLALPATARTTVDAERFGQLSAYDTRRVVYGTERRAILTHSPQLHQHQARGFTGTTLAKAARGLDELAATLARGKTRRHRTKVEAEIRKITHDSWVRRVIAWHLDGDKPRDLRLTWSIDPDAHTALEEEIFGKHVLITDHDTWPVAEVIAAYRSQSEAESSFRQMKDRHVVSFSPMFHWTEHNIRVHVFTCVLALQIAHLMRLQAERAGLHLSVRELLTQLAGIGETVLIYPSTGGRPKARRMLTQTDSTQDQLATIFQLNRWAPAVRS